MERRILWRCLRTGLLSYALGVRPNMINGRILSLSGANRYSYWWRKRLKGLSHGIVIRCNKAEIKRKNLCGWSGALEIDAALYTCTLYRQWSSRQTTPAKLGAFYYHYHYPFHFYLSQPATYVIRALFDPAYFADFLYTSRSNFHQGQYLPWARGGVLTANF